jgi:predicted phage terminase large subunit-like protein
MILLSDKVVDAARAELARRHFRRFVRMAWPFAGTSQPLADGWYVDAICDHLQAAVQGQIKRLLITIPPRMGKSTFASVCLPAWCWIQNPADRMAFSSYSDRYAQRDSMATRDLVQSKWFRERWVQDKWRLLRDRNTQRDFGNTAGGRRMVLGKATGEGADSLVCVDDPISADDAHSDAERESVIRWWTQTMSTRANNPRTAFVIVMQRLHERDLAGYVLDAGGYEHLLIPMEYDPRRSKVTSLGWKDPRTLEGELLCPERYSRESLDDLKRSLGSYGYAGQMNQNPAPAEGGLFKKNVWRFWKPAGVKSVELMPRPYGCWDGPALALPKLDQIIVSVDTAQKTGDQNDRTCMLVIGCAGAQRFVLERRCGRMTFPEQLEALAALSKRPGMGAKLIEETANGRSIIDTYQTKIPGIVPIKMTGDSKESRAASCLPELEAGQVYLPEGAAWLDDFVAEFATFPNGAHDDQVDALSQALNYLRVHADMSLWMIGR